MRVRSRIHRHVRKALKVLASLLLLYVMSSLVFDFLIWHEIHSIRREGDPITLAQHIPPVPPDAQNGAIIYQKAFRLIDSQREFTALHSLIFQKQGGENATAWTQARAEIPNFMPVVELAREAASKSRCSFKADWKRGYFPANPDVRLLSDLLCAYSLVLDHDGDNDAAISNLELALRAADSIKNDHTYISCLIRMSLCKTIADTAYKIVLDHGVDQNKARILCDALAWDSFEAEIPVMLKCERATYSNTYDEIARSGSLPSELYDADSFSKWRRFQGSLIARPLLRADQLRYLRAMRRTIKDCGIPFRKLPAPEQHGAYEGDCEIGFWLSDVFDIDIRGLRSSVDSYRAHINGTRVAIALCVYSARIGKYPQSLDDLTKLGWKLDLQDPFSGKDFVYKPQPNGFLLYSIGPDLTDNGGKQDEDDPIPPDGYDMVWAER